MIYMITRRSKYVICHTRTTPGMIEQYGLSTMAVTEVTCRTVMKILLLRNKHHEIHITWRVPTGCQILTHFGAMMGAVVDNMGQNMP